jgi:hypothetical protein
VHGLARSLRLEAPLALLFPGLRISLWRKRWPPAQFVQACCICPSPTLHLPRRRRPQIMARRGGTGAASLLTTTSIVLNQKQHMVWLEIVYLHVDAAFDRTPSARGCQGASNVLQSSRVHHDAARHPEPRGPRATFSGISQRSARQAPPTGSPRPTAMASSSRARDGAVKLCASLESVVRERK